MGSGTPHSALRTELRVAVDGRALTSPAGGVRRYVTELWRAMPAVAPDIHGVVIGGAAGPAHALGLDHHAAHPGLPTNLGWSAWALPRAIRRVAPDVLHAPAYTAPLWGRCPVVLTVHDVSYARHPEWYPHESDPLRRAFYARSARRADLVLTDSTFSQQEIVAAYGLDPARIIVVPLGVSPAFTPDPRVAREPVVLHVGDLHTRRNLSRLLEVVLDLRAHESALSALRLVLIGTDRGQWASLQAQAVAAGAPEAVTLEHGVDDEALCAWYRRASVFAYPSRYEGFGLPLLEAMACGTPVVASRAASIPEVVGTAGMLVDPDDTSAWREALAAVLLTPSTAAALGEAGPTHAATFTWARTAAATAAVYRRAKSKQL